MFFAIINNNHFHLDKESTVVFETIILNEGDGYNKYDGVFVAPEDGIYLFSWTVSSQGSSLVMTKLVVDSKVISSTGERNNHSNGHTSAPMTTLCRMKQDCHAFIRTTGYNGPHYFHSFNNHPRNSLLGVLVHVG